MEREINKIVDKYLEGNYLIGEEKKVMLKGELLILFVDETFHDLFLLYEWLQDPNREPARTKFTAGLLRNTAKEIEFQIKSAK